MAKYDVTGIAQDFFKGPSAERTELIREFKEAVTSNLALIRGIAEIANSAQQSASSPAQVLQMSMMYGMAIGVLLERDLARRKKIQ